MSARVLVAMSGGVDSSVAAALLVEQGYDVVGATMKLFCYGDEVPDRPCCSLDSINDARDVAHALGIPHYVLNLEDRFALHVIENFVSEYAAAARPIPCVRCNSFTKFRDLLAHADALDCDYIATGHYAVARDGALLSRAATAARTRATSSGASTARWWPGCSRRWASSPRPRPARWRAALGLGTADKPESVEICFVPDDDYVGVLEQHLPADAPALAPGSAGRPPTATVVGEHGGYARYTIGQRRGLPGGFAEPLYVVAIRPERREVVVGTADELGRPPGPPRGAQLARRAARARATVRGADPLPCPGRPRDGGGRRSRPASSLVLAAPIRAITPGQSGVLYSADGPGARRRGDRLTMGRFSSTGC